MIPLAGVPSFSERGTDIETRLINTTEELKLKGATRNGVKEGRGKRGRGKGEPTNCYTALWCHSGLLRHGPGISPEWCPRARFLLSFLRVVSPPLPSRSYPTLPPRSPSPSALSLRCWSTKGRGREGLPTCV